MVSDGRVLACVLAASVLAFALSGCVEMYAPSPQRIACLQGCGREKDTCILNATEAALIQQCDEQSRSCGAGCSP